MLHFAFFDAKSHNKQQDDQNINEKSAFSASIFRLLLVEVKVTQIQIFTHKHIDIWAGCAT